LQPTENTTGGRSVEAFDEVPDPEDDGEDIQYRALSTTEKDQLLAFLQSL
jgi:hypothetical protein